MPAVSPPKPRYPPPLNEIAVNVSLFSVQCRVVGYERVNVKQVNVVVNVCVHCTLDRNVQCSIPIHRTWHFSLGKLVNS